MLLTATVSAAEWAIEARIRDLSERGALLESESPPAAGAEVVFSRGATRVAARVAWAEEARFGLEFATPVVPAEVLVHVSAPMKAAAPKPFRRPGLQAERLKAHELRLASAWGKAGPHDHVGE